MTFDIYLESVLAAGSADSAAGIRPTETPASCSIDAASCAPNFLETALALAESGYKVFPVAPGTKFPLRGSHAAHDGTTDTDKIRQWWSLNPLANIGIATDGMLVVDCDVQKDGSQAGQPNSWGTEHAEALQQAASAIVKTPNGGTHYYFRAPEVKVRSSVSEIAPGVDIRAGAGSYAVTPPSKIDGGRRYHAQKAIPRFDQLAPAPEWIVEAATRQQQSRTGVTSTDSEAEDSGRSIPEGRRNQTLASMAGAMRRNGLDESEMNAALQAINNNRCNPPLDEIEVDQIASSIARYAPDPAAQARAEGRAGGASSQPDGGRPPEIPFVAFPTATLPQPVRDYVEAAAESIGCCPSFVALPLLTCLAAAIGATRCLALKPDWTVPAILWGVTVGNSGTWKSPALDAATMFVEELENRLSRQFSADYASYVAQLAEDKKARRRNEDESVECSARQTLTAPVRRQLLVSDTTVEALVATLNDNPRGVLLRRDELNAFFGSFDRYANSKGADEAIYLSMYRGRSVTVDRRTSTPPHIHVPQAYVSICGTIQPGVLARVMGPERRESGLLARFLLVLPPARHREWSEASVSEQVIQRMSHLFDQLFGLTPAVTPNNEPMPLAIEPTPEAKAAYIEYFNRNADRLETAQADLAAAYAKLEETPARFALIVHCIRHAAGEPVDPLKVDEETMSASLQLADWFCGETERIYGILNRAGVVSDRQRLVDWISGRDGRVTAREVQQGCRWLKNKGAAQAALENLVAHGFGVWEQQPLEGGRRVQQTFVLQTGGSENVDTVDV